MYRRIAQITNTRSTLRIAGIYCAYTLVAAAQIVQALLMSDVINAVSDGLERVVFFLLAIAGTMVVEIFLSAIGNYQKDILIARLAGVLTKCLNRAVCRIPFLDLSRFEDGDVLSLYTNDLANIRKWYNDFLRLGFAPLKLLGVLGVCLWLSWKVTLSLLIALPVALLIGNLFAGKIYALKKKENEQIANVNEHLRASLQFMPMIKTYLLQGRFIQNNQEKLKDLSEKRMATERKMLSTRIVSRFINLLPLVLLFSIGAIFVVLGEITVGHVMTFSFLVGYLSEGLDLVTAIMPSGKMAKASIERMLTLLSKEVKDEGSGMPTQLIPPSAPHAMEARGVFFTYSPKKPVLYDLHFTIEAGMKVAVIGASGSGKTTLFRLLAGLCAPDSGSIRIQGRDINEAASHSSASHAATVTQESFLFPGTVRDNLRIVNPHADDQKLWDAIRFACADDFITMGEDLCKNVGDVQYAFSHGQIQRLSIARAVVQHSRILLLDEPTSAQDIGTHKKIENHLLQSDYTVVVIMHRLENPQAYDRILWIEDGKIAGFARHAELCGEPGYRQLLSVGDAL